MEALNFGDADGVAYEEIARTRSAVGTALAAFGEDSPAAEASIAAALATLDVADSTMITGTDQNGRLRAGGKLEMRAVDALERDVVDPSSAQSATAVAGQDQCRGAHRDAANAGAHAVSDGDRRAAPGRQQARPRHRGGGDEHAARPPARWAMRRTLVFVAGAGDDLRTWRQP